MIIRNLVDDDQGAWRSLWDSYCAFYETAIPDSVSAATWARAMAADGAILGRGAFLTEKRLIGFSLSIIHPSTWRLGPSCYLEDLFVDPAYRASGVGKSLIDDLIAIAHEREWARLYWHTRAGNETARRLYERYGAADDFVRYRVEIE